MSGKKRFDFDATSIDEDKGNSGPVSATPRLGPMAAAVRDAGQANKEARSTAPLDELQTLEMAVAMRKLRAANLDLRLLALGEIDEDYLRRDRREIDEDALNELKQSIREQGLSQPIRVDILQDGRFGLNQGRRRLLAFKELYEETSEDRFARIPALVDTAVERESAYRRMVDENLIREDVAFSDLAALAMAYAADTGLEADEAIRRLFASASRQRRAEISAYVKILSTLGGTLKFPQAIGRDLGRVIARKLEVDGADDAFRDALLSQPERDAEAEISILERASRDRTGTRPPARLRMQPRTFRVQAGSGPVRRFDVAVAPGKIVISGSGLDGIEDEDITQFLKSVAQKCRGRDKA
jgi:ParB family chromosome partitioning protein